MRISQSVSPCGPKTNMAPRASDAPLLRGLLSSLGRWLEWRRRQSALSDLKRLLATGDHLVADLGLDPRLARSNPTAALAQLLRRGRGGPTW